MTDSPADPRPPNGGARPPAAASSRSGLFYGLAAYFMWGFIPLYFRAIDGVPPLIVVCHRIFWSALFLAVVVTLRGEWGSLAAGLGPRRQLLTLCAGSVLIALNWLIFIYAVATQQLLQASLGYFINPLLSIALGVIFLHERLRRWQWLAVGLAVLAVVNLALRGSGLPWLAISLAGTFGGYGLVRKKLDMNSLHGLLVETALLLPVAVVMLAAAPAGRASFNSLGILSLSGIITAVPLLCFGAAVRRLQLSTVGFLQYVGPTLQFLVAIGLFHETMDRAKLASFGLCWLAIAVYLADSLLNREPPPVADEPE